MNSDEMPTTSAPAVAVSSTGDHALTLSSHPTSAGERRSADSSTGTLTCSRPAIVLAFEPDDAIRWYQRDDPRLDAHGRHEIGYIYLTLHRHMGDWAAGGSDDLVLFEFGTTGSKMSAMFSESESVRRVMVGLLEGCRGVCGIFDWEDHATLFWWRGRELDVELPEADLDLAEVARFVPPEASL
ncbi:hypothetical protein [Tessaracoccus lapidicaptus]|uniref:hypothetical protein n=1 Tax=Tessaracoccus lapidicaptus TaxID=1427523 RepID=UPI0033419BBD